MPAFDQVVVSVDCAFKSAEENDYVAIHKYALFLFLGSFTVDSAIFS